nr:hypothetical protein [Pandoravirus massiliensis]
MARQVSPLLQARFICAPEESSANQFDFSVDVAQPRLAGSKKKDRERGSGKRIWAMPFFCFKKSKVLYVSVQHKHHCPRGLGRELNVLCTTVRPMCIHALFSEVDRHAITSARSRVSPDATRYLS